MTDFPQWLTILLGSLVPVTVFATFWMTISSRLTKAETNAEDAVKEIAKNCEKINAMSASYNAFREKVATEYIHREIMGDVEDRLTAAIDRLGERFDRFLERLVEK